MSSFCFISRVALIRHPVGSQVRTMKAVNTRMKKPMHIMRAKLMKLTEYEEPVVNKPMAETCMRHVKSLEQRPENPTEMFYAKLCRRHLDNSKLVAVFHNEGLDAESMNRFQRRLIKHNLHVKLWGSRILREAISDSKYHHFGDLIHRYNLYVTCEEPRVAELLKAMKKTGRLHLLGGLVEDKFMSLKQMQDYALLPSLEVAQGQLAGILSSAVSRTHSLLQLNQQMLSVNLEQLAKGNVDKTEG